MSDDIVVATESFSTGGNAPPVTKGETFRKGHPVTEGREEMFKPFVIDHDLETATAAPGERRKGRPRSSKAEDKADGSDKTEEPEDTTTVADVKKPEK